MMVIIIIIILFVAICKRCKAYSSGKNDLHAAETTETNSNMPQTLPRETEQV